MKYLLNIFIFRIDSLLLPVCFKIGPILMSTVSRSFVTWMMVAQINQFPQEVNPAVKHNDWWKMELSAVLVTMFATKPSASKRKRKCSLFFKRA